MAFTQLRSDLLGEAGYTAVALQGAAIRTQGRQLARIYGHLIIDVGGRDTGSLRAALTIADVLLIPTQPRSFDLWRRQSSPWSLCGRPVSSTRSCGPWRSSQRGRPGWERQRRGRGRPAHEGWDRARAGTHRAAQSVSECGGRRPVGARIQGAWRARGGRGVLCAGGVSSHLEIQTIYTGYRMAIAKNPKRSVIAAAERQAQKFITGAGKPVCRERGAENADHVASTRR